MSNANLVELILAVGAFGGLLNAYFATGGFIMPSMTSLPNGQRQFVPGFIGNIFVGAAAAVILGAFYGPLGDMILGANTGPPSALLTLRSLAGAALTGLGGSRLLTQAVDRQYNKAVADNLGKSMQNLTR